MNRKLIIIVMLILITLGNSVYADNSIKVDYYGVDTCINCKEIEKLINEDIIPKYGNKISITKFNLKDKASEEDFLKLTDKHNGEVVVPTIFVKGYLLQGSTEIKENLVDIINDEYTGSKSDTSNDDHTVYEIHQNKFSKITVLVILAASLLDGINPCAIAMLLFFMSLLIALNDRKKILLAGLSYCTAIFITYLAIGIGLVEFLKYMTSLNYILIVIHIITIVICSVLIVVDTKDYLALKSGNVEDVKNELPKGIKHKIHNLLRKQAASPLIVVTTFITGIAVALLEFSCTGQVYLPTITFILNQGDAKALVYLIMYNIGFIMPIVVITFAVYKSNNIFTASNLLISKRKYIKLISIIFYTCLMIYFIISIQKII